MISSKWGASENNRKGEVLLADARPGANNYSRDESWERHDALMARLLGVRKEPEMNGSAFSAARLPRLFRKRHSTWTLSGASLASGDAHGGKTFAAA